MNSESKCQLWVASVSPAEALKRLHAGAVLMTATSMLAVDWKRRALPLSSSVISTPVVVTWNHWLADIVSSCPDIPVPFTAHQEAQLWETVIRHDIPRGKAASARGLARHAAEVWTLMRNYRIDVRELALGGEEAEALARWIAAMQEYLATDAFAGRTLMADIPQHLYTRFCTPTADVPVPGCMMLDGFELLTPIQHKILDALQQSGCEVFQVRSSGQIAAAILTACPDESSEFRHIAQRIKVLLDQDQDKDMRIVVLTAESGCDVAAFRRILDGVLIPDICLDPVREIQAVATAGDALSDCPMVGQALHLLSLAGKKAMTLDDFSPLLFMPWLTGFQSERIARAALDAKFREQNRRHISLKSLLKSADVQALPLLLSVIRALNDWKTSKQSAADWVKSVHALLLTTGFVRTGLEHERPHSNLEIRQMNAFRDILTSLVALDAVAPPLAWPAFLSRLRASCAETRFNLAPVYPNVVVMPLYQAAGLQFEHVFVMGMDEEAFPPSVRPHPLLPVHLQQKYGIPMGSRTRVFESSCWLWEQVLWIAPTIECSYAQQKDEREMLPSSFVAGFPEKSMEQITLLPQLLELETFEDAPDVPLSADEDIHGGTSIIKNQSACPFRAFARHRLNIVNLGETTPGIEASDKGSLIHLALEFIWGKLKSQAALVDLTESERAGLLDTAIEHAWKESRIFRNSDIQSIEKKRMRQVLNTWLDVEAVRPLFEVREHEKVYTLVLPEAVDHPCSIRIKVDRIDQDMEGRRILIDYKTGQKQSVAKWLGERMEEPQLPLYALAAGVSADDAVTFATVRSGDEMGFEGLAGEDTGIDGIAVCDGRYKRPEDWQQVLDDWRVHINALAQEFVEGRSTVTPRNPKACAYCGLEAVCRIEETGFETDIEDEA
ncbi:MAG: PD-(D/E)XK nuclease family protein [Mariprofundaceae bacterium]|nr:PD-(D/E)XK nuclease family protein [Mariprofundaceae bacterium]